MGIYSKDDYNADPVNYCGNCLSLNIKELSTSQMHVCGECGNIHKEDDQASLEDWNKMYIKEYGHDFLSKKEAEVEEE